MKFNNEPALQHEPNLLVCQRIHVPDDLSCHLPCIHRSILESAFHNGEDQGQGWSVDEVDESVWGGGFQSRVN